MRKRAFLTAGAAALALSASMAGVAKASFVLQGQELVADISAGKLDKKKPGPINSLFVDARNKAAFDKLGDDGYEPAPDETVEIARVATWAAPVIVTALQEEGIRATSTEQAAYPVNNAHARIFCAAKDTDRARQVVDEVTAG